MEKYKGENKNYLWLNYILMVAVRCRGGCEVSVSVCVYVITFSQCLLCVCIYMTLYVICVYVHKYR